MKTQITLGIEPKKKRKIVYKKDPVTCRKTYLARHLGIAVSDIKEFYPKEVTSNYKFKTKTTEFYNFYTIKTFFNVDYVTEIKKTKDKELV